MRFWGDASISMNMEILLWIRYIGNALDYRQKVRLFAQKTAGVFMKKHRRKPIDMFKHVCYK